MRIVVNITEESGVDFFDYLITYLSEFGENEYLVVAYRESVKRVLHKIKNVEKIKVLFTQTEIFNKDKAPLSSQEKLLIREIEDKYSLDSIWQYAYQDRTLIWEKRGILYDKPSTLNRDQVLRQVIARFRKVESSLNNFKPDAVLYLSQDFGTSIATILFEVARQMKLKTLIPMHLKFDRYFTLNNDIYGPCSSFSRKYVELQHSYMADKKYLERVEETISSNELAFYAKPTDSRSFKLPKISSILNLAGDGEDVYSSKLRDYLLDRLRIQRRKRHRFQYNEIEKGEDYIFFPLHYEPELVLLVQSQEYLNQLELISRIQRSLPDNNVLVVKDHPLMNGRRKKSFYAALQSMHNVKLVHYETNSFELINNAQAVITVIGTAGVEAFFRNIPVITLSRAWYNVLPGVEYLNDLREIASLLKHMKDMKTDVRDKECFIKTVDSIGVNINLNKLIKDFANVGHCDKLAYCDLIRKSLRASE